WLCERCASTSAIEKRSGAGFQRASSSEISAIRPRRIAGVASSSPRQGSSSFIPLSYCALAAVHIIRRRFDARRGASSGDEALVARSPALRGALGLLRERPADRQMGIPSQTGPKGLYSVPPRFPPGQEREPGRAVKTKSMLLI